jgi:hypothetical protein
MGVMRLSDDKARRLTQLVWRERARRWLPLIAAALVLLAVVTYFTELAVDRTDRSVDVQVRTGTVTNVKKASAVRGAAIIQVHLEDGRDIDALSGLRVTPQAGAHVMINEVRHASGRLTYELSRLAE